MSHATLHESNPHLILFFFYLDLPSVVTAERVGLLFVIKRTPPVSSNGITEVLKLPTGKITLPLALTNTIIILILTIALYILSWNEVHRVLLQNETYPPPGRIIGIIIFPQ